MILDIPNHIEQNIVQMAKNQGITVSELIIQWLNQAQNQPTLLTDFVQNLPNRTHLGDGLAIQKELRNEWD